MLDILEQVANFCPFAFGVYLTYGVLKRPDLTVDGSFVLGAGVYAKMLLFGLSPPIATLIACSAGALAGIGTAIIQYKDRISALIAGILALFILQSVNFMVMGRPNITLLDQPHLLSGPLSLLLFDMVLTGGLVLLLCSRVGLLLRAFGSNTQLLSMMGKKAEGYRMVGFALSNALVALSGSLTAQSNGFADIGMGTGLVLIGIGVVIIGQQACHFFYQERSASSVTYLLFTLFGVLVYFFIVNLLISFGMNPIFLKMFIGVSIIAVLRLQVKTKGRVSYA